MSSAKGAMGKKISKCSLTTQVNLSMLKKILLQIIASSPLKKSCAQAKGKKKILNLPQKIAHPNPRLPVKK